MTEKDERTKERREAQMKRIKAAGRQREDKSMSDFCVLMLTDVLVLSRTNE